MRITIVCDVLGKANNGTSIAAYNLINFMLSRGHEVHVVCGDEERTGEKGYYVVPTRSFGIFNGYVEHNGVKITKKDDLVLMRAIRGSDIVHIMMPFGLGKRAAKICYRYGIPCTAGFHVQAENFSSHFFGEKNPIFNWAVYLYFYDKMYKYIDAIHYPSSFIQKEFEAQVGKKTHGYVISNGVEKDFCPGPSERPGYLKDKILILFSGRYTREKAQHILIKAIKYSKYADKIQLIFAGQGPRDNYLKALTKSERLLNYPIFQFFTHDEIVKTIRMCDLYVHPSNMEIEGISCLEAIAGGLVPIVSDSKKSATREFAYDELNLFKADDPKDLALKIDYWIANPKAKKKRAKQYRKFLRQFDRDNCMRAMEKMFNDTINECKGKKVPHEGIK